MNKALYIALEARLKDSDLGIKYIDLFNNQLQAEGGKDLLFYPCILIAYSAEYESLSQNIQKALVKLTFYLAIDITGVSSYQGSSNQTSALEVFDLKDKVHQALQGFSGDFFTPLIRVEEVQDTDYQNIQVFQLSYETEMTDISAWAGRNLIDVEAGLEINKDLDIENLKIRT